MITNLSIKNFKSIKEVSFPCKRINLFIGEPNTGKSNILEGLGLCSWQGHKADITGFIRFTEIQDLFYDHLVDEGIEITLGGREELSVRIEFEKNRFIVKLYPINTQLLQYDFPEDLQKIREMEKRSRPEFSFVKYYKFLKQEQFPENAPGSLLPPNGANLFAVIMGNKKIGEMAASFFEPFNLKFMLVTKDKTFEVVKTRDNLLIGYPYTLTSDTLQRLVFFTTAMESNTDSTLVFEEPEAYAFPFYTKYLGERIARDNKNQYFISTHNPYLLLAILEKAPKDGVNVFITYSRDNRTRVKPLAEDQVARLLDWQDNDPFLGIDRYIGGA